MRLGGALRLLQDLLSIVFFAVAEVCERLAFACQAQGLEADETTKQLIRNYASNN